VSGIGAGVKFSSASQGHTHIDTPKVHYGPEPPAEADRGDVWVQT